jgi:hypothetical protein
MAPAGFSFLLPGLVSMVAIMNDEPIAFPDSEEQPQPVPVNIADPATLPPEPAPAAPEPAPAAPEPAPAAPEPAPGQPAAPEPAPDLKPVADRPDQVPPGHCPICAAGPFERVDLHIRFKHKGYKVGVKTGGTAPPKKPAGKPLDNGAAPEPPPADFSDLNSEPAPTPRFDTAPGLDRGKHFEATAVLTFDMTTGILSQIFGEEWQPNSPEEKALVVGSIKRYYESVDLPDLPPGYVLCFVALAYAAPRLGKPKTKNKLLMGWYWLKSKFTRKKYPMPKVAVAMATDPANP